jgi:hypothetical protein
MTVRAQPESLAYHSARLLLVIWLAGKPQNKAGALPGVEGRTLLAKLDFFVRYPAYLVKAKSLLESRAEIPESVTAASESPSVESRMVRFLYGPWDHLYYTLLAYLVGKGLVTIEGKPKMEVFRVTGSGAMIANKLASHPDYADIADRAALAYRLFNRFSGSRLKDFIYENFPEVVSRNIGDII